MRVDICVPAYNEEAIIIKSTEELLSFCQANLKGFDWQIVLLINGSNDQSEVLAKSLSNKHTQVKTVVFVEGGRGQALKKYWLASSADILAYMDIDLAVQLEALPKLLEPLIEQRADLTVGNRYHKNSFIKRSWLRSLSSITYNFLAKTILHHQQKDLQCGFKAVSKAAFLKLKDKTNDEAWFFDTELIIWAEKLNFKIVDIPVNWQETRLGQRPSKVRLWSTTKKFVNKLVQLKKLLKTRG